MTALARPTKWRRLSSIISGNISYASDRVKLTEHSTSFNRFITALGVSQAGTDDFESHRSAQGIVTEYYMDLSDVADRKFRHRPLQAASLKFEATDSIRVHPEPLVPESEFQGKNVPQHPFKC